MFREVHNNMSILFLRILWINSAVSKMCEIRKMLFSVLLLNNHNICTGRCKSEILSSFLAKISWSLDWLLKVWRHAEYYGLKQQKNKKQTKKNPCKVPSKFMFCPIRVEETFFKPIFFSWCICHLKSNRKKLKGAIKIHILSNQSKGGFLQTNLFLLLSLSSEV